MHTKRLKKVDKNSKDTILKGRLFLVINRTIEKDHSIS